MLFTGSQNIDFSRRYVPMKLVFYTCESRLSRRFSRNFDESKFTKLKIYPRVFKIFTRGFQLCGDTEFYKKNFVTDF